MALTLLAATSVALATSAYEISRRVNPGFLRGALLLPMAAAFFALPALAVDGREEPFLAQTLCCILSMSAFKLIALSAGRGCLADPRLDRWTFLGVCLLPVIPISISTSNEDLPKRKLAAAAKVRSGLKKLAWFLFLAFASISGFRAVDRVRGGSETQAGQQPAGALAALLTVARGLSFFFAGVALMNQVDGLGDLVDAGVLRLLGVVAEPHFDNVHMATSFSELWGRRWNLTVSSVLRAAVYQPWVEGRWLAAEDPRVSRDQSPCSSASSDEAVLSSKDGKGEETPFKTPPKQQPPLAPLSPSSEMGWAPSGTASTASAGGDGGDGGGPRPSDITVDDASSSATGTYGSGGSGGGIAPLRRRRTIADDDGGEGDGDALAVASQQPDAAECTAPTADQLEQHPPLSETPGHRTRKEHPQQPRRHRPSAARRFTGCALAFLVSGLWHELVCFTMARSTSGGYWLLFFTLQAPILWLEMRLKRLAKAAGIVVPYRAARLLTHALLLLQLCVFWYPPMVTTGMVSSMTRKVDQATVAAAAAVQRLQHLAAAALMAPAAPAGGGM